MLHREALGERDLWSVVQVPCVADEDARSALGGSLRSLA